VTLQPPEIPVFTAGLNPLPADFAGWVTAPAGFQTAGVVFRAQQTVTQTLTGSVNTVQYDAVLEDPYSGWNATGMPANSWTPPFDAWYQAEAFVSINTTAVNLQLAITVNGSVSYTTNQVTLSGGTSGGASAWAQVFLIGGQDYITVQATPSAGSTPTDTTSIGRYSQLGIILISQ